MEIKLIFDLSSLQIDKQIYFFSSVTPFVSVIFDIFIIESNVK